MEVALPVELRATTFKPPEKVEVLVVSMVRMPSISTAPAKKASLYPETVDGVLEPTVNKILDEVVPMARKSVTEVRYVVAPPSVKSELPPPPTQVPLTAKQPAVMLKPAAAVLVALDPVRLRLTA